MLDGTPVIAANQTACLWLSSHGVYRSSSSTVYLSTNACPIHSGEVLNENFSNMAGWVPIPSIEPSRATALRPAINSALQAMKSIHGYSVSTNWAYSWQNLIAKQVKASADCENGNGALSVNSNDNYKNSWTLKRSVPITDIPPKPALRVAYQGIPGAYSEEAAILAHPGCQPLPCQMCEMAVRSVECRHADRAILPVESASEGSIHRNYDLLLDGRLHIVGEIHLSISYCLLTAPGVKKEDVKRVISHPLAISQCQRTLTDLGLNTVARQTVDDTAAAAHFIAFNNLRDVAAIASSRAAEIYGLQVLARGIQDDSCDVIRFVILAREPVPIPTCTDRPPKTSIVIAHDGELHLLFKVLSAFSFRNINLTKLESRPGMNNPIRGVDGIGESAGWTRQFQYVHYIDFEASMADRRAQNALAELREFTTFIRVLGSYPADLKT